MTLHNIFKTFVYLLLIEKKIQSFNPFMDNELFMINWAGPLLDIPTKKLDGSIVVMTKDEEKYQCILPESEEKRQENSKNYNGPTPDELMEALFTQSACSYRIESYWTYELCHSKYLRQYHETKEPGKKPKIQEYFLGYHERFLRDKNQNSDNSKSKGVETVERVKSKKIDGIELPYYEVNMTDGTNCDLLNAPRRTRLLYVCQPDGHGEIYDMKESSTCEYEIMVLTAVLCSHPDFRPKNPPVNQIQCHAIEASSDEPKAVSNFESASTTIRHHTTDEGIVKEEITVSDGDTINKVKVYHTPKATTPPTPTLGPNTDKQILRDFLSSDYCLQGGTGWWKHEFCYNKHARQYHDGPEGRQVIYLGHWNFQKHLEWLQKHPSKRPKEKDSRKHISLLYTDGDICDLTGNKRITEVRLKCIPNEQHPHAVALYLMEPSPCNYILGIESPLFCSLLMKADDDGIFTLADVKGL
ncbi:endoplasmic reticulum lectin 1 isoform X3 [Patella vulgata]|uniref:endoplasmic reticulum lectin 1 isoform X4 n=1 Tax=Patella vulgata TaxID=6465 RepID=UPI00217FDCC2|nr:endoplasmic reticulum lectin 1 isoform X4 [Patella vulgata]XP_050404070.1 endoplasmic reticulum lectin 1 isoform X3 [Patella vulgata]